jgi:hypothetical protein
MLQSRWKPIIRKKANTPIIFMKMIMAHISQAETRTLTLPSEEKLPTNPWTGVDLDEDNFNPDWYDTPEAVVNTEVGGPNDDYDYEPGEMRFGTYTPLGTGRIKLWGLIGMDGKGTSIRGFDAAAEEIIIFVLHN